MRKINLNIDGCPICKKRFCGGCPDPETFDYNDENALQRHEDLQSAMKDAQNAIRTLVSLTNVLDGERMNKVANAIAQQLMGSHRTLQQSFARSILGTIIEYFALIHEHPEHRDPRNEAAAALGAKLKEIMDDNPLPLI